MNDLHNQLMNACEYYAILDRYDSAVENLMDQNADLDIDYENIQERGFPAAPGILIIIFSNVFLWLVCMIALAGSIGALALPLTMFFFPFLIVGGILIYKLRFCKARTRKIQQEAQQEWLAKYGETRKNNDKAIDRLVDENIAFSKKNSVVLDFLPDIYRTPLAVAFMERAVRTGRAETLKEAINLYEEQLHRWTLEEQGRQLLQQSELQGEMIRDQLSSILDEQRRATNSLQNIETLEFYNTFCR